MRRSDIFGVLCAALVIGALIAWVDSRPTWDDTGITAGVLLLVSAGFGAARPRYAWLWALGLGAWIPVIGLLTTQNMTALPALVIAFIGAYVGVAVRTLLRRTTSEGNVRLR